MKILVATASRHGATTQIGAAIAATLREAGLDVDHATAAAVESTAQYEAIVIGSGVYAGRWLGEARELVKRESSSLRGRQVWLFSSGPLGTPLKPDVDPVDVPEMTQVSGALEHRVFGGRIDRSQLGFGERAIVSLVKAPEGDYREWDEIRAWAKNIGARLTAAAPI